MGRKTRKGFDHPKPGTDKYKIVGSVIHRYGDGCLEALMVAAGVAEKPILCMNVTHSGEAQGMVLALHFNGSEKLPPRDTGAIRDFHECLG